MITLNVEKRGSWNLIYDAVNKILQQEVKKTSEKVSDKKKAQQ